MPIPIPDINTTCLDTPKSINTCFLSSLPRRKAAELKLGPRSDTGLAKMYPTWVSLQLCRGLGYPVVGPRVVIGRRICLYLLP